MGFITAFAGARDAYQVPLALYENELLTKLVTDFYSPSAGAYLGRKISALEKLNVRHLEGLPSSKTKSILECLIYKYINSEFTNSSILSPNQLMQNEQNILSKSALDLAVKTNSNLLLYAGYAYEAFRSSLSDGIIKGVFQYHPHIQLSSEILRRDLQCYPQLNNSTLRLKEDEKDETNAYELTRADFIICNSTFTARSIEYIGVSSEKIHVVPYGIDIFDQDLLINTSNSDETCNFLFVGSGIHRKGLHHLLQAWEQSALPNAKLTIVSRRIDAEIVKLISSNNVDILLDKTNSQLKDIFRNSHIFILPSLVEGFGYVYLEALSQGCYCIGTNNTGFPDIQCPDYAGALVEAGNIDSLSQAIINAFQLFDNKGIDKFSIQAFARQKSWDVFRNSVSNICQIFETYKQ